MAGSIAGGKKAAETNKRKYGKNCSVKKVASVGRLILLPMIGSSAREDWTELDPTSSELLELAIGVTIN